MQIVDIHHSLAMAQFPDLETLQSRYGWSAHNQRVFQRLFQLKSTALHDTMTLEEALTHSARALAQANPALVGQVDMVLYCHAISDVMPFDTTALERISWDVFDSRPECYSVTMGSCSSAIIALQFLQALDDAAPKNVVILTGEKCFFRMLDYAENNGLFGEATSATWIKPHSKSGVTVKSVRSGAFEGVWELLGLASADVLAAYDKAFIPTMTRLVENVLAQSDVSNDAIDVVLPTHLSPFTFNRISTSVGICSDKVLKQNLDKIGHCFCGDLFINISTWLSTMDDSHKNKNILSFAAGMTGSYAAIVLTKDAA